MATRIIPGQTTWKMKRDRDGYRTYTIKFLVTGATDDGPAEALATPGLPPPGTPWLFGGENDPWCTCLLEADIEPYYVKEGEPSKCWEITNYFSNKPESRSAQKGYERPKNDQIDNPLLEPMKISGGGVKYQEEATVNRFGYPIVNSAYEPIRGPTVEFDASRHKVTVEQNVPLLEIEACTLALDTVNALPMWGIGRRRVKLSQFTWEKKYYQRVNAYYTRHFEFEINNATWDKYALDEGTKCLRGHWDRSTGVWLIDNVGGSPPSPFNPAHFQFFQDRQGNMGRVVLNGFGLPAGVMIGTNKLFAYVGGSAAAGKQLSNPDYWIPIVGDVSNILGWFTSEVYERGNLVFRTPAGGSSEIYISTTNANSDFDPLTSADEWINLAKYDVGLTNKGLWNGATSYAIGQYVSAAGVEAAGFVFISKYNETDFVGALGVPAVL